MAWVPNGCLAWRPDLCLRGSDRGGDDPGTQDASQISLRPRARPSRASVVSQLIDAARHSASLFWTAKGIFAGNLPVHNSTNQTMAKLSPGRRRRAADARLP